VTDDSVVDSVREALEGGVEVAPERRGFGKVRGVPDSVFWVRPDDNRFESVRRMLPILVELEGTFLNGLDDFEKFASRYDDKGEHQYCVKAPIIGESEVEGCMKKMRYEIIGIRANQIADDAEIIEKVMHDKFSSWFERLEGKIDTGTSVGYYDSQTVVEWEVTIRMFGYEFETSFPFIISGSDSVSSDAIQSLRTPTLPSVVVVNNKYCSRDHAEIALDTGIEFTLLHPTRF